MRKTTDIRKINAQSTLNGDDIDYHTQHKLSNETNFFSLHSHLIPIWEVEVWREIGYFRLKGQMAVVVDEDGAESVSEKGQSD